MTASDLMIWITFGLVAGLAPGPLLTLVISETVQYGRGAGFKVALAPLITDAPLLLLTYVALSMFSDMQTVLGILSILGATFIAYLAYENLTIRPRPIDIPKAESNALRKGAIANLLNPHPYVFWFSIGMPTLIPFLETNWMYVVLILLIFYVLLLGSKMVIAALVSRSRSFLNQKGYIYTLRFLGLVLLGFAVQFVYQGITFLR